MQPVKGHAQLATRARLARLMQLFSRYEDEAVGYARFGREVGADEEAVKSWMKRGTVPKTAIPGILEAAARLNVRGVTADWLLLGAPPEPQKGAVLPPGLPQGERSPSGERRGRGVGSASVRELEAREAARKGFLVLAGRIARTIQQTITGNELGYTAASRASLADSLEVFAQDLDRRCGEKVCGDIWEVVAWLRKPADKGER